jgi:hypothetical protein
MPSSQGKKHTPREVSRQREVDAWRQQCWTHKMIAEKLGITEEGARKMLLRHEKRLFESCKEEHILNSVRRSEQLEHLLVQALHGWKRSLDDAETYKEVTSEEGSRSEVTRRGQSGNAAHISNRKIWGSDAPPKAAVTPLDTEPQPDDAPKDDQTKKPIEV